MGKNLYISDLHFNHFNILRFDSRPYTTTEEMEDSLVKNWNSVVTNSDTVYHLGDFCWGKANEWCRLLDKLNGSKVMIKGNHDLKTIPAELKRRIADIKDYKEIYDEGRKVIMCHYPI